ncbi:MAG: OmpH family outer membrane protein [Paludibacteraceae bacterium]|nr:OmpH family outer membrane protein [Paludibacteraceae bacterium]
MKKLIAILSFVFGTALAINAQKQALVDINYILSNLPQYEAANEQLTLISRKWQKEIETAQQELQVMTKNYQTELVFLSDDMKARREEEILAKENSITQLKRKYFGQDGELFKKREALIKPIQDEIYSAIQEVCKDKGYDIVTDKSAPGLIYSVPKYDISDIVLQRLGITK